MPWMTATGGRLDFPTALWAKIMQAGKLHREDVMDALNEARRIHEEAISMNSRIIELEAQVLRLKHENEFMLRLVNERDSA